VALFAIPSGSFSLLALLAVSSASFFDFFFFACGLWLAVSSAIVGSTFLVVAAGFSSGSLSLAALLALRLAFCFFGSVLDFGFVLALAACCSALWSSLNFLCK